MKPRWTVLIIDDHAPSRAATAKRSPLRAGRCWATAAAPRTRCVWSRCTAPTSLICAVGLPESDGVEARAQGHGAPPSARVVLLTSRTGDRVAARAVEAGVLGFLVKPLRAEELGPVLDLAVSRFRDLQAVRQENETLKRRLEGAQADRARQGVLIQRLGLSEPEAFRRIQKTAMDSRKPMAEVAQAAPGRGVLRRRRSKQPCRCSVASARGCPLSWAGLCVLPRGVSRNSLGKIRPRSRAWRLLVGRAARRDNGV